MFNRKFCIVFLFLMSFQAVFSQTVEPEKPKIVTDELRKEAVVFLRETLSEVNTLRTLENRIGFSSEMAGLMWFYDEKEAKTMYQAVISDFKQLILEYDSQMNALGMTPSEAELQNGIFGGEMSDKARLSQKFFKAMNVRQQIAMSLAEHDGTLALNFYYDTLQLISNVEIRKKFEERDAYFEIQLIKQIASQDAAKAAEYGRKSLTKGFNWMHLDLLKKIYEKDPEKGAEFAEEILKKLKSSKVDASNFYYVGSFLSMSAENLEESKKNNKKPMLSEQGLRDLAEILAQSILKAENEEFDYMSQLALIEKFAPARAIQIRAKFANKPKTKKPVPDDDDDYEPQIEARSGPNSVKTESNSQKEQQEEMMKNLQSLGSKPLPKEEREKVVAEARKIIGGMANKQEKIVALSLLAAQVTKLGDRELAAGIMKDAQSLVNPQPKNYRDFLETWFLISGFAQTEPEKAFPILEDAIFRLNGTLEAFIKVGEFIDVSGEFIDDGEVQVGAFGSSMINGLTRELGMADATIRTLAIADFARTKGLTNRFDRTEVRILAKLLILRAVLGNKTENKDVDVEKATEDL